MFITEGEEFLLLETNRLPPNFTGIIEYSSGIKMWLTEGKRHRIGGAAVEYSSGSKAWWVNGKLHRLDGPACEYSDGSKTWWVDGKNVTKEQHALLIDIMKLKGIY